MSAVDIVVDYPTGLLSLPGNKAPDKLKARVGRLPSHPILRVDHAGKALRVVLAKSPRLPNGELFTVEFDRCDGADRATAEDFTCTVTAAANSAGGVSNVVCSVRVP